MFQSIYEFVKHPNWMKTPLIIEQASSWWKLEYCYPVDKYKYQNLLSYPVDSAINPLNNWGRGPGGMILN